MQKAIQLFEQDFARWGLHLPSADVAARSSGLVREAGWHVLYDFGQDSRGEFLDYYAALRDGSDAAVTDDWHVRIYDTGDRVPLPTVLEAYMYSRDPTPDELARARRKFTDPQAPATPAPAVAPKAPARRPIAAPLVKHASPFAAALPNARTSSGTNAAAASADAALDIELDNALAGVAPVPESDSFANWLLTPALGSPPITFEPPAAKPAPKPAAMPTAMPVAMPVAMPAAPGVLPDVELDLEPEIAPDLAPDLDVEPDVVVDVVPEVVQDVVPEVVLDDLDVVLDAAGDDADDEAETDQAETDQAETDQAEIDDDVTTSDLVFVAEPPAARVSDRTPAITLDDDTLTISMSDDDPQDETEDHASAGATHDSVDAVEGFDHFHTPSRVSSPAAIALVSGVISDGPDDALGNEFSVAPDDEAGASVPPAGRRPSPAPAAMLTTDIAAVAGSFDPWWYRPTTRRIVMAAAAVIAIIIVGSVITHHSPAASDETHAPATHAAPVHAAVPAPAAPADQSDTPAQGDSAGQHADTTPDSLPVASAQSSVSPETGNPPAEDGIARPAGPQSVPPIQQSGTGRASVGSGRTADKTGFAQH